MTDQSSPSDQPSWHRGNWMQTYSGRQFYPLAPRPEDIHIVDIAHALAMQCRYNGHVHRFYSVAEHCVLVSRVVPTEFALWGLLHDATEAYVGDMVRPLKLHMPEYRAVEDRVMVAIAERFGLDPEMPAIVKDADTRLLLDEREALLGGPADDWNIDGEPFGIAVTGWSPAQAEHTYLERFAELTGDSAHEPRTVTPGAWARDLADRYADIARRSVDAMTSEANAAEASKYYGIAARMDRTLLTPASN